MAVNNISFSRDFAGNSLLIRPAPEYVDTEVLVANTNVAHNVPAGADIVIFSSSGQFFAKPNAAAVIPVGQITNGTGSEQNPSAWALRNLGLTGQAGSGTAITTINLIASAAQTITLSFYKIDRPGG